MQINYYNVVYSDGVTVLDTICASNLAEAKKIAADRAANYNTAYYKVCRAYNGGVRANMQSWH